MICVMVFEFLNPPGATSRIASLFGPYGEIILPNGQLSVLSCNSLTFFVPGSINNTLYYYTYK